MTPKRRRRSVKRKPTQFKDLPPDWQQDIRQLLADLRLAVRAARIEVAEQKLDHRQTRRRRPEEIAYYE